MAVLAAGETVTRRRYSDGAADRYGNPTKVPATAVLSQLAAFDPGGSREPVEADRASLVTTPKLYFAEAPDLVAADEVQVRGAWYTVEGNPAVWSSPFGGGVGGVVVELREVAG